MRKLRVTVDGKAYEVLVESPDAAPSIHAPSAAAVLAAPVSAPAVAVPAPAAAKAAPSGPGDIPSPLAGKVVSIDVKVGESVAEGAQVATVEAMKMNTYIYSPRGGSVAAILANPGDGVEEGTVLLRLG